MTDRSRLAALGKFIENVAANEGWCSNDTVLELLAIARAFEARVKELEADCEHEPYEHLRQYQTTIERLNARVKELEALLPDLNRQASQLQKERDAARAQCAKAEAHNDELRAANQREGLAAIEARSQAEALRGLLVEALNLMSAME